MQGVYIDRAARCALVFNSGLKWLSYIGHTGLGPRIFKSRLAEFTSEFRELPGYEVRAAALKYLTSAVHAYEYEGEVVNQLLEIVMGKQPADMSILDMVVAYNDIAKALGMKQRKSFKSKAEGLAALEDLDRRAKTISPQQAKVAEAKVERAEKLKTAKPVKEPTEKKPRGSGIGAYCLELIAVGKSNAEVLAAVKAKFPDAKTTMGCVAFYRNKAKP